MKKEIITIAGKDYSPILVGFFECCLNCDLQKKHCHYQCHYFEDSEEENVALKRVIHEAKPSLWERIKQLFMPIESEHQQPS
ncbi:MAG: hypothetical protein K2N35_16290 [Muribaculaceae bacterium]|nr:hypothetical protein [Muribaculaceae bacterium]